jgi:hypothetical protein
MAAEATACEDYQIVSTAVDPAFYRTVYPELDQPGLDPVRHYVEHGWREGRDPAPWFSVRRYLEHHPDIAAGGIGPLTHFLRHGGREGREFFPSEHAADYRARDGGWRYAPHALDPEAPAELETPQVEPLYSEADRALIAAEFDAAFYAETNPDVLAEGMDLIVHFLIHGWREGRDPTPWFCVREYLQDHPDIAQAGVNPFAHYLAAGRSEGRAPKSRLGFRYRAISGQVPLAARMADARARAQATQASPDEALRAAFARTRSGLADLHITFSHDDFARNVGGVQLCLQYESAQVRALGRDHLHVYPATHWPALRVGEAALVGVSLNGEPAGFFSGAQLACALAEARAGRDRASFAIHNLLGHGVDEVVAIVEAAGLSAGFIWLHDFTSLCTGYQLLRNDVADCAAPPADSAACGICHYGPGRSPQVAEHERLFRRLRLTMVSPSKTALDFWRSRSSYPVAGAIVHPHVRMVRRGRAPQPAPGPLRVAFLGLPAVHKGWPVFAELAERHAEDPRYRFLHLGAQRDPRAPVEFHRVSVSVADPRAMRAALERLEVDVALIWSIFRETFCLAAYEAAAAGAAIVTGPDSANVAAFVASSGHGRVLADEAALAEAFASGEAASLARSVRRPWLYDLEFSGMTADLLQPSVAA